jgi:hypothetical protein
MLTLKQYLASDSTHCPVCSDDNIEGDSVEIEATWPDKKCGVRAAAQRGTTSTT